METTQKNSKSPLDKTIAEINKKHGENVIGRIPDMKTLSVERIPSGIPQLDAATGGGFPLRRMVELYGIPSSGKSLIALLVIKEAQKKGYECIYIDVEDCFDPTFAQRLGVDIEKLVVSQSTIGEDTLNMVCRLLDSRPGVIVVDSVAAMITEGEMEEDLEKQFMAPKARLMSKALSKINALNQNTLLVFINQLRSTLQMYGPQTTTTGGRALSHYASIRIEVKRTELLHEDDKKTKPVIGQIIGCNVTKNKTAKPYQVTSFKFLYKDSKIE